MGKFRSPELIILLPALIMLSSCTKHNKHDEQIIGEMKKAMESSSNSINISTAFLLRSLEDKTTDFCSMDRAKVWYPKASLISEYSTTFYDYLEIIKQKKDISNNSIHDVVKKTLAYKKNILATDSSMLFIFGNEFGFINKYAWLLGVDTLTTSTLNDKDLTNNSFAAVISMFQNEIRKIENKTIAYCNTHVGCMIDWFDSYSVIIGQNSKVLQPGHELEIQAGVGAFSRTSQPEVTINNRKVKIGTEGFSTHKIKVSQTPGNYELPVRIKFFNPTTGEKEDHTINIEYTVVKICDQ